MKIENLKEIEQAYDFLYPTTYYNLLKDNMLDWGLPQSDWHITEFPKLKKNPPLLLFGNDFEIISFKEIIEEIESFSDEDDYRETKKEFYNRFIPFGKTGAGDLYCFYLNEEKQISSIVLVWHDANEVNILANNLQDFIFRQLLECVTEPYEEGLIMNGNFKENVTNQLSSHKEYLKNQQIEILSEIYDRDLFIYDVSLPNGNSIKAKGLITDVELSNVLLEQINFINFDKTFEYQNE